MRGTGQKALAVLLVAVLAASCSAQTAAQPASAGRAVPQSSKEGVKVWK